jgi:hypothetical protein
MNESKNITFSKLDYNYTIMTDNNILKIEKLQNGGHKNNNYYTYYHDSIQCIIINHIKTIVDELNLNSDTQIIGGNNKKNIVRLYNCYVLSQNQNDLSYKIKKKLDKKIVELKNLLLEGGTDNKVIIIDKFIELLINKYVVSNVLKIYIINKEILDYLKILKIINNKISNEDLLKIFEKQDILKNIFKSIIEYYFKLIIESININNITNQIKLNNEIINKECSNKIECLKIFLKNKFDNTDEYKDEQIITIIIFILIYIFDHINNTTTDPSSLKNKTITFFNFNKTDNIKSIIKIFNNNKFIDEQKNFVSNNKLINIIKNILDSGNFKQKYTNLIKKK